jgi:transketolase
MEQDENVLFLAADIGGGLFKPLKSVFPNRVINVGIAEQNMIGMAAGLTNLGFRVICYSKACFVSLRVVDQIKNALCYAQNNVIIIAADAGYDEANAGYAHISVEDLGIIRSLAEINVYVPTTITGMRECFQEAVESAFPSYIRMNKEMVCETKGVFRKIDRGLYYLKESPIQKTLIITHGISAKYALAWSESQIETCSVMAVDQFQKIDSALQSELKHYEQIIVFEEQFKRNGLYEFVEELVIEGNMLPIRLLRIGPETLYKRLCFVRESKIREEIADSIDL